MTGLDFDSIVTIGDRWIRVYEPGTEPPMGQGLNKRAHVYFYYILPTEGETAQMVRAAKSIRALSFRRSSLYCVS